MGRCWSDVLYSLYSFPILFPEVFWGQHQSRFVLADDLHINILKFVAGHGTVVQPASINIVSGWKQAQQYSRTYQLGFIRAVTWSAQNPESHWSQVHITLKADHFSFHAFCKKCGLQRDLMSCSSWLTLQRRYFLAHFRFLKKLEIFLMLLGIMHAAPLLPNSPLISSYQQQKHLA